MPTFIKAAKSFKVADGNDIYVGPVIVSEDCIYLTSKKVLGVDKALTRNLGLAGAVLSKLVQKEADPFDFAEPIPEAVLNDPDWPVDADLQSAIIIRREDVEKIKYPFWGSLNVTVNGVDFNVMADFFSRKKIMGLFKANQWQL